MPNPRYEDHKRGLNKSGGSPPDPPGAGKAAKDKFVEKCPAWPGLPGKTGPERSAGVRKAKTFPKSEGL